MNTIESNTAIDSFLGSKGEYISYKDVWGGEVWGEYKPSKYHSDWNLLMEVVEKIEKTQRSKFSPNTYPVVTINSICCNIKYHGNYVEIITEIIRPSKIEAVYNACFEFIKWYNQQTK
jgi:hypothetical protein